MTGICREQATPSDNYSPDFYPAIPPFRTAGQRLSGATRWLAWRLTTDQFNGLPLTGLIGLLLATGMILSEVAENIVNAEPMVLVDAQFTRWLFRGCTSQMSQLFYLITWFGPFCMTIGVTLLGSGVLLWYRQQRHAFILWLTLGGVSLLVLAGKRSFQQPRPLRVAYYPETGYSFPSGHSATAMIFYGLLAYWSIRRFRTITGRVIVGTGAVSLRAYWGIFRFDY